MLHSALALLGKLSFSRFVGFVLTLFLLPQSVVLAGAGDACTTYADCSLPYNICVEGFCSDCAALGDQTSCQDIASGAATLCAWQSSSCIEFPEVPSPFPIFGILALCAFFLIERLVRRRKVKPA